MVADESVDAEDVVLQHGPDIIMDFPCLRETIKGDAAPQLAEFRRKVKAFERRCDRFYLDGGEPDEAVRKADIARQIAELTKEIPETATSAQQDYWQARLLRRLPDQLNAALELTERALRRNAFMVGAFLQLAEINFDLGNMENTLHCIRSAYHIEASPKTQAYLSMAIRQRVSAAGSQQDKMQLLKKAISLALEAVDAAPSYLYGKYNLGMCFFCFFFAGERKKDAMLRKALGFMQDITTAEDPFVSPDVLINMAEGYNYLQDYGLATSALEQARAINPTFHVEKLDSLRHFLDSCYSDVSQHAARRTPTPGHANHKSPEAATTVTVLASASEEYGVAKSFVVFNPDLDRVCLLSIFNVVPAFRLTPNDRIKLSSPQLIQVSVAPEKEFTLLRCADPTEMERNGQPVPASEMLAAGFFLST